MNDLKSCLLSGLEVLTPYIEELNAMNVFPVADADTGNNLARTLETVKDLDNSEIKSKLFLAGRGNSGNMLALFFRYWPEKLVSSEQLQSVLPAILEKFERYIPNLQHGTIYDVMTSWPRVIDASLDGFFSLWLKTAELSIITGPDKLPILEKYGTLDSGAIGLYYILYGIAKELGCQYRMKHFYVERAKRPLTSETTRYCVEALVETSLLENQFKNQLKGLGDSLIFIYVNNMAKLHIHTNDWQIIREICEKAGQILNWKVDDMQENK